MFFSQTLNHPGTTSVLACLATLLLALPPLKAQEFQIKPLPEIVLYEVNLRAFSQSGDFLGVVDRLDNIKRLGANTIWLMPIHPIGKVNRIGEYGSPYSVQNFNSISSEYGTEADLAELINEAHKRDIAVILDFVANHTAWDHAWIDANPDWYTQDAMGNIIHPLETNWLDVADLNFDSLDLRNAMIDEMKYWVESFEIDGFRFDAADLIPSDFWQQAIPELRSCVSKDLLLLAEGDRPDHLAAGFDLIYGWSFFNQTKSVFNTAESTLELYASHLAEFSVVPAGSSVMRFTTNHDETAFDAPPPVLFGSEEASRAAFATSVLLGGTPLIYSGQEIGWEMNTPFFEPSPLDWMFGADTEEWYRWLLETRRQQTTLRNGETEFAGDHNTAAIRRWGAGDQLFGFVNCRHFNVQYTVPTSWQGDWYDLANEDVTRLDPVLNLEPYEVRIFSSRLSSRLVVAGELQTEQGDPNDWDPSNSSLIMSDDGGVYSTTARNLLLDQSYGFKILDDAGTPPANWGDEEITPNDLTLIGDADGIARISVNSNRQNNIGTPIVWIDFDAAPLQVVGNFMDEAGGMNDWNPADSKFATESLGKGLYAIELQIDTAGTYQFKTTFGTGWNNQVGSDGFNNDAAVVDFEVAIPDQRIVLFADLKNQQLGSWILGDTNHDGMVNLLDIEGFIEALNSGFYVREADTNLDGVNNLLDIEPFVAILSGF